MARLDTDEAQAFVSYVDRREQRAEFLCRRISQALIDLDLDQLQEWAKAEEGVVSFGDLELRRAERLTQLLETLAERARRGW